MVGTTDEVEEHPDASPTLSAADGGCPDSHEEFNLALDTLKTSMMTKVKGMFKEFLDGLKLSTAPLELVPPTNKVADASSYKGEASCDKVPLSSGRNGSGIFSHVEPPLTYRKCYDRSPTLVDDHAFWAEY